MRSSGSAASRDIAWTSAALLGLSGASGLVFQVLWVKQLSLVVGIEVYAITIGVSAFFTGLAAGSYVFGRVADRRGRPFLLYAALELAVAVSGVAATVGLAHAPPAFAALGEIAGPLAWVLPFALVGVPAFAMGGTLPAVVRAVAPRDSDVAAAGGGLYAANTAGAIAGTLAAPFVLIPALGVTGSAIAAALLNLAAAGGAVLLARRAGVATASASVTAPAPDARARLAIVLYAVAGGVALGYEVVWSQVVVPFNTTRAFSFAVVLATYLAGLALGSAAGARAADRSRDPWGGFAVLIAAAGLVAMLEIATLGPWLVGIQSQAEAMALSLTDNALAGMSARFAVAGAAIVFIPTLLLGAAFPFVLRLAVDARRAGRHVGAVVALNTAGGIAGTMLTGFVLVPVLGLVRTLALLTLGAVIVGAIAVLRGPATRPAARWALPVMGALVLACTAVTPRQKLVALLPAASRGTVIFYEESRGATVAVVEQSAGSHRYRRLYINGVSNSGDPMPSLRYMRLQALLPVIIHDGEVKSTLVIALGTGITAGALLAEPGIGKRVVAELLPAVARATPLFNGNYGAPHDPRIDLRLRDGRQELLRSAERYDLITLEPPPPSAAGVVNLYSRDFYRLAAARLAPHGIVAQWLPLPPQNDEDSRSLVRSFIDVFPNASLWTTDLHEMMLVGSPDPMPLDVAHIKERFAHPGVSKALSEVGVGSAAALMATWITDRAGLEAYAGDAKPVTDDDPRIEYAPWVRPLEVTRVLPKLLALRHPPPLQGADPAFTAAVASEWDRLSTFYAAGLAAYHGDRETMSGNLKKVLDADPGNPYYRWYTAE
jgi:predicted membrane-bound spermidine synthase